MSVAIIINPSVGSNPPVNQSVSTAQQQIQQALLDANTISDTDKLNAAFLLSAQDIPFDGAGQKTSEILQPQASDFNSSNQDFSSPINDAISTISSMVDNPLSSLSGSQGSLFNAGSTNFQGFDQVQAALRSFFLLSDTGDSNLAGLLLYAIEETTPSMINTTAYITQMQALVKQVMEGCSKLPVSFIPEIPNLVIIRNLCDADSQLSTVLAELSQYQTLDLTTLAFATTNVCKSKDLVKSGIVPSESIALLKSVFSLTDIQTKIIATTRFTPDPSFRLKLQQIQTLDSFILQNGPDIEDLNTNVLTLLDTLSNIDTLGISSIMQLVITTIQGEIQNMRAGLEAEAINFIRQNGFSVPDRIVTDANVGTQVYDVNQIQQILQANQATLKTLQSYSTVINNVETFTELSALCIMMGKVNGMYKNIQNILTQQSKILATVKKFVVPYISSACSKTISSSNVDAAVTSFVTVTTARLSGQSNTNDAVMSAGQALLNILKAYKLFVSCVHSSLKAGSIGITNVLNNIPGLPGHAPTSVGTIADLTRYLPQIKTALRTLDIKRITGAEAKEYDALTKLIDGLQSLAAACNNSYVQNVCRTFMVIFKKELDKRKSIAVTTGSMGKGEVPSIAWATNVAYRAKNIQKNMDDLQKFVSADLTIACQNINNVNNTVATDVLVTLGSSGSGTATTRAQQAQQESDMQTTALNSISSLENPQIG